MYYDPTMLQQARRAQLETSTIDVPVFCTHLKDQSFGTLRFHPLIMHGEVNGIAIMLFPNGMEGYFGAVLVVPFYQTELWTTLGMLYGRYQERIAQQRKLLEVEYGGENTT